MTQVPSPKEIKSTVLYSPPIEYAYQEMVYPHEDRRIFDIPDPPPTYTVSMNWRVEDGHCFHMRFEPAGFRYVTVEGDPPRQHYLNFDAKFTDECCHTGCSERIIR